LAVHVMLSDSDRGRDYVAAVTAPLDSVTLEELRRCLRNPPNEFDVVVDLSSAESLPRFVALELATASQRLANSGRRVRVITRNDRMSREVRALGVEDVVRWHGGT
jgi:anti-anti-sigma regulatory factor